MFRTRGAVRYFFSLLASWEAEAGAVGGACTLGVGSARFGCIVRVFG